MVYQIDVLFDKKFYYYLPISIAAPYISTGLTFHQIFIINQKGWTIQMLANGFIFLGISLIVFRLSVIISPSIPSPLDNPKTRLQLGR